MSTNNEQEFAPVIMVFHPWSAKIFTDLMKSHITMQNATIFPEIGISGALETLEQHDRKPDAYFIDAPIFGNDRMIVDFAIELLEAHKEQASENSTAPHIFLFDSHRRAPEAARILADQTKLKVHLISDDSIFEALRNEEINSFDVFIQRTRKIYEPHLSKKERHLAKVAAKATTESIPAPQDSL